MLPTLRQLQYLKLLAHHGSFSRAAEAAYVTQPTLSAGIQELEKILGAPLVDRNRSGVILTAAGEEAVGRAGAILAQTEDLVREAQAASEPLSGRFRLGVIPTIAPFLLPAALPVLRAQFPKLRLFLREDLTHRLVADVRSGALDAALIALPYDTNGLDVAHVEDDELVAAFPPEHPLSLAARVAPEQLRGEELILLEDGHCLRDQALAFCTSVARGRGPAGTAFGASSLTTVMQMVAGGYGVTLIPQIAADVERRDDRVKFLRLANPQPGRSIGLAFRRTSPRKADFAALGEVVKQSMAEPAAADAMSHPQARAARARSAAGNKKGGSKAALGAVD